MVDSDPEPFREGAETDPSQSAAFALVVGPGPHDVVVEAGCPVAVVAGVATPTVDGSLISAEATREVPAERHAFSIGGDGGLLTVVVIGDCDEASVEVSGTA